MTAIDITIVPVRAERKVEYLAFSRRMAEIYREHGASRVVDCWQTEDTGGDADFHAADAMAGYAPGSLPDFRKLAGAQENETVVVSFTEWPSKEAGDRGVAAATADLRVRATMNEEPVFDGSRLIAGAFTVELDVS